MSWSNRATSLPLLWQGSLWDASGYSEETRCLLYACDVEGASVAARDWPTWRGATPIRLDERQRAILELALVRSEPPVPYVEVLHKTILPASRATLYPQTGPTVLRTMFETDSLPTGWADHVSRFDAVWVPSEFNVRTFSEAGVPPGKLHVLPQTVDFHTIDANPEPLPLPEAARGTRFLSVFEFSERKGWRGLLDAWADTFGPSDDVCLVIKFSTLVMRATDVRGRIDAYIGARSTAPIVVVPDQLSSTEMARLYRACDAFVLATRGEGWGRPLMEAMAAGLPTIGSAWGGSREFMSTANSFLVQGRVLAVTPGDLVFPRYLGQRWFEPDREELGCAMLTVAAGGSDVAGRAATAAREIRERFSAARIVLRVEQLAAQVLRDFDRDASAQLRSRDG